jgi:hypothetical protein
MVSFIEFYLLLIYLILIYLTCICFYLLFIVIEKKNLIIHDQSINIMSYIFLDFSY